MAKMKLTPEMLASVDGLPAREAAARLGVGKTTITDARAKRREGGGPLVVELSEKDRQFLKSAAGKKFSMEQNGTSLIVESQDSVPQTKEHIEERMRARGFDPEQYSFTYRFSEWEAQTAEGVQTLYAARAGAVERKVEPNREVMSLDELNAALAAYTAPEARVAPEAYYPENTFVFNFADPQFGKTDFNGGTAQTVERFMNSLAHAEYLLNEEPATRIIWADLGDGIENFCNTSSQRQTNDLNLVEQVRILRRMQLEGLLRLSQYAPITHVSVPSNHSQNRVGPQQPASTAHDDWGLEVQEQLNEVYSMAPEKFGHEVEFLRPDEHLESCSLAVPGGLTLGFVHGHRSTAQNGLENWWAGQTLGRQPTADADILLVGHFHNYSVRSVGKERYIITTPSLDNGSSWFTVSRGNVATAGVLTLRIEGGKFRDAIIA